MKLKIYEQGGGLIYTPFIPEQWVDSDSRASAKGSSGSNSDEDNKIDPLYKELLGMMKDQKLLPSDISIIYKKLIQFQRKSQYLSELGDSSYRSVMPGMLQLMSLVSQAKVNKEDWDSKLAEIKHHNAGSEVAMDSYGKIWVSSKDGLIKIDPSEYDPSKYAPISNSQLMAFRQRNSSMAFQDDMLADTGLDVVGGADVRKEIDDIIDKFGTIKSGQFKKQVFKDLASDLQGEGIFKLTTKYSKADLNDFSELLFSQLSAPAKHLIAANSAIGGYNPVDYIRTLIIPSRTSIEVDPSYEASLTKANGLGGSGGSGTDGEKLTTQNTYQYRFGIGDGVREQFLIAPTASKIHDKGTYLAQGIDFGPMLNWDLRPLDPMNLQKMFFSGGKDGNALAASVNTQDITFGNHFVTESERPTIFYNGNSGVTKVYLPWVEENGHIKPDFEKLRQFNAYREDIKNAGNITPTERNAILAKYPKLTSKDIIPSEDGKSFTLRDTKPFLAFSAFAGDDTIKFTKDELLFLRKVDKSEGKRIKDLYNSYVKYDKAYGDKKKDALNRNYAESESGDFWEGIVFVSAKDAAWYAFNSSMNEAISKESTQDIPEKVMANEWLNAIAEEAKTNPNYNELSRIGQHF